MSLERFSDDQSGEPNRRPQQAEPVPNPNPGYYGGLSLNSPLEEIAEDIANQYYFRPFPHLKDKNNDNVIDPLNYTDIRQQPLDRTRLHRRWHGFQHVCRVAALVPYLLNFYDTHRELLSTHLQSELGALFRVKSEEERKQAIKLMQIVALLHASGRFSTPRINADEEGLEDPVKELQMLTKGEVDLYLDEMSKNDEVLSVFSLESKQECKRYLSRLGSPQEVRREVIAELTGELFKSKKNKKTKLNLLACILSDAMLIESLRSGHNPEDLDISLGETAFTQNMNELGAGNGIDAPMQARLMEMFKDFIILMEKHLNVIRAHQGFLLHKMDVEGKMDVDTLDHRGVHFRKVVTMQRIFIPLALATRESYEHYKKTRKALERSQLVTEQTYRYTDIEADVRLAQEQRAVVDRYPYLRIALIEVLKELETLRAEVNPFKRNADMKIASLTKLYNALVESARDPEKLLDRWEDLKMKRATPAEKILFKQDRQNRREWTEERQREFMYSKVFDLWRNETMSNNKGVRLNNHTWLKQHRNIFFFEWRESKTGSELVVEKVEKSLLPARYVDADVKKKAEELDLTSKYQDVWFWQASVEDARKRTLAAQQETERESRVGRVIS